jgi:hypothetical protein
MSIMFDKVPLKLLLCFMSLRHNCIPYAEVCTMIGDGRGLHGPARCKPLVEAICAVLTNFVPWLAALTVHKVNERMSRAHLKEAHEAVHPACKQANQVLSNLGVQFVVRPADLFQQLEASWQLVSERMRASRLATPASTNKRAPISGSSSIARPHAPSNYGYATPAATLAAPQVPPGYSGTVQKYQDDVRSGRFIDVSAASHVGYAASPAAQSLGSDAAYPTSRQLPNSLQQAMACRAGVGKTDWAVVNRWDDMKMDLLQQPATSYLQGLHMYKDHDAGHTVLDYFPLPTEHCRRVRCSVRSCQHSAVTAKVKSWMYRGFANVWCHAKCSSHGHIKPPYEQ